MALDTDTKRVNAFIARVQSVAGAANKISTENGANTLYVLCNGRRIIHYGLHPNHNGYPAFELNSTHHPLGRFRIPLINALRINGMQSVRDIIIETLSNPIIDSMIISAIRYTSSPYQNLAPGIRPHRNDELAFLARFQNVAITVGVQGPIDLGPTRPANQMAASNEHIHIRHNGMIIGCYGIEFGYAFQLQNSHPLGKLRIPLRVAELQGLGIIDLRAVNKQKNEVMKSDNIVSRILNAPTIEEMVDIVIASAILDTP